MSLSAYARFAKRSLLAAASDLIPAAPLSRRSREKALNRVLGGYPRNHKYRVRQVEIVPGVRLFRRQQWLAKLLPRPIVSFLDVGCCKGFFVLDAARHSTCDRAVGIDVYEPFVEASEAVRKHLELEKASFHVAGLEDVANDVRAYGGLFQTVSVLNVYHYLFWGSGLNPAAARDHGLIFKRLASVCAGQVIFSSPLALDACPGEIQRAAKASGDALKYNRSAVLSAAEPFFDIHEKPQWGQRPVFVMSKRGVGSV